MRKLLVTLAAFVGIIAVATPASAVYVDTQVLNRGTVAFIIANDYSRAVLARGGSSYFTFGWTDVDSYTLGAGVCASVSVNGGPWSRIGPGTINLPDAVRSVQVQSFYC